MTRQMTPIEALHLHKYLLDTAYDIMVAKRADYSGEADPFKNFRLTTLVTGSPASQGVLVRLTDKLSRLGTVLAKNGNVAVQNESLLDTVRDIVNYVVILYSLYLEEHPDQFARIFAEIPTWDDPEPDAEDVVEDEYDGCDEVKGVRCPNCRDWSHLCDCDVFDIVKHLNEVVWGEDGSEATLGNVLCPICRKPYAKCSHESWDITEWWAKFPSPDMLAVCPICHDPIDTCPHTDTDVINFMGEIEAGDTEWYFNGKDDPVCPICGKNYYEADCPHDRTEIIKYAWTIIKGLADEEARIENEHEN